MKTFYRYILYFFFQKRCNLLLNTDSTPHKLKCKRIKHRVIFSIKATSTLYYIKYNKTILLNSKQFKF
jgi:hypothetical protein